MPGKNASQKVECLNPNTGGRINIDKTTHDLFSKAIRQSFKKDEALTFTQIVERVHDYLKRHKITFDGSVDWYAISVKHDMHARGLLEVFVEKGRKLHRLRNRE